MKNFMWDSENKTIRGSFVNLVVTITILLLVCIGAFIPNVAANLEKQSTLIIGFFTVSFGVWQYGKIKGNETTANSIKTE